MKTFLKIFFIILLAGFIILQFFQPDKNIGEQLTETDMVWSTDIPVEMAEKIMTSCYDCHSDYTHYPWCGYVSPVSLLIDNQVRKGKEKLNFSVWTEYSKKEEVIFLGNICSELLNLKMPPPMYMQLHRKFEINTDDIFLICDWTDQETDRIVSEN